MMRRIFLSFIFTIIIIFLKLLLGDVIAFKYPARDYHVIYINIWNNGIF